jgi:hypothetical protein
MSNTPENAIVHDSPEYGFECPQTWDALAPTDDDNVRYCKDCQTNVTLCGSLEDAVALMNRQPGTCAAYPKPKPEPISGEVEEVGTNRRQPSISGHQLRMLKDPERAAKLRAFIDSL